MALPHLFRCLSHSCIAVLLSAAALPASAEAVVSPLSVALEAAWQLSPLGRSLMARRSEITASRSAAQAWTPGVPSLGIAERSDRLTGRDGVRETEISLSAPVWLPGQQSARMTLAEAENEQLSAQIAQSRLSIAGNVREKSWAVAAAREALDEAREHEHHLAALAEEVARRVRAGDLARTDGMLAQQEVLGAQAAISAAQAHLNDAVSGYQVLTGLSEPPAQPLETIASAAGVHPRLHAAQAALVHAEASFQAVKAFRKEGPIVGVSARRERDREAAGSTNTIGVAVQIPFGGAVRNAPLEAAALTQVETARAELGQVERAIQAETALAGQQLQEAARALDAAAARAQLTAEHVRLIDKAFRLGERGLADLIRARSLAHEAEAAERQQRVAVGLAHARVNQAKGILP